MLMVGVVFLLAFVGALLSPPDVPPPTASELVAIPGINPMIPLWWGVIGFIVALVIHEFGHGLLARGHGMRIRSFGLLQLTHYHSEHLQNQKEKNCSKHHVENVNACLLLTSNESLCSICPVVADRWNCRPVRIW